MKFTKAISSGFTRAYRSVKAIIAIWFITFLMFALFAIPLRSSVFNTLGNSFSTELIKEGFNLDFWVDLASVSSIQPHFSAGTIILIFVMLITYIFLNGGLFDSLRANNHGYTVSSFFGASAKLFGSFLIANLLVLLMILFTAGLIIGVPVLITRAGGEGSELAMMKIFRIMRYVFLLALLIFLLVIDYTRAWLAANDHKRVFKALGYGFMATFKSFFGSLVFMILIVALQIGFVWFTSKIFSGMNPTTTGGLFLLFLITQFAYFLKLFLRAWRYGGVTTLYET